VLPSLLSTPVETMAGPLWRILFAAFQPMSTQYSLWWTWRESNPRPRVLRFEGITTIISGFRL